MTSVEAPTPAQLVELLQLRISNPERRAVVAALGAKLAILTASSVLTAGADTPQAERVRQDLQHIKSQLASLSALEAFALRDAVQTWLERFLAATIAAALS
jgi:hypothetical protein